MKKKKNKGGRPTKYFRAFARQAGKLCELGATDVQLADFFRVSPTTIETWKKSQPEFLAALTAAKTEADNAVEAALFRRAMGAEHPDTHFSVCDGMVVATPTTKHYPPDTTACIFWLKNRRAAQWREKIETAVTGPDGDSLTANLALEIARAMKK